MYRIATTPEFDADLERLDRDIAGRIVKKVEWLSNHPEALRFPLKHPPKDLKGIQKVSVHRGDRGER